MKKSLALMAGAVMLIGLTAGCGSDKKTSTAKLQEQLALAVSGDGGLNQGVKLNCPGEVTGKKGTSFDCKFSGTILGPESGPSVSGTVTVTLENDDGSNFSYKGEYAEPSGGKKTFKGLIGHFQSG